MVWNITEQGVRTKMTVVNPEAYPICQDSSRLG